MKEEAKKNLDAEFEEAYRRASETHLKFPPDILLHFYAYYKKATDDYSSFHQDGGLDTRLVSAFKMNAIFQVKNMSKTKAKKMYIELVNKYIPE